MHDCSVEVLIPDFSGSLQALRTVVEAKPQILGHNVETVPRLYPRVRPQAKYRRSLEVLRAAKDMDQDVLTKSDFMVGLGEMLDKLLEAMDHLQALTFGSIISSTNATSPCLSVPSGSETGGPYVVQIFLLFPAVRFALILQPDFVRLMFPLQTT